MTTTTHAPAPTKTGTRHVALAIIALAMGGFGIGTTEFTMMGLLKEIEQGLNISTPEAGHLISAYALGVVIGAPVLAAVGAKLPRKYLALGLMLFFSIANLSSFLAPDYGSMLVSRFAAGLPHGAFFGVAAVIAASLVAPTKRGWAISMVMAGLTVSNVIGVPFATWLGQSYGWRLLFLLVGLIGIITLWSCCGSSSRSRSRTPMPASAASSARSSGSRCGLPSWSASSASAVSSPTYTYISHTMTSVAGLPAVWLPLVVALYGVGMVVGNIVGGRIADKSVMGTIYWVLPGTAVALVVYAVAVHWAWSALVMVFVVGAAGSMLVPALQTQAAGCVPGCTVAGLLAEPCCAQRRQRPGRLPGRPGDRLGLGLRRPRARGRRPGRAGPRGRRHQRRRGTPAAAGRLAPSPRHHSRG